MLAISLPFWSTHTSCEIAAGVIGDVPVSETLNMARDVVKKYSTRSAIENGSPTGAPLPRRRAAP